MRLELIENPTFLRYYERWQRDPTSIVFAAISEIFRTSGMIDEAIEIAEAGLKYHPNLVSGRLALAKAYLAKGEIELARNLASSVLKQMPTNADAKAILNGIEKVPDVGISEPWHTLTIARIYTSQGYTEEAKKIYKSILELEPDNEAARMEFEKII